MMSRRNPSKVSTLTGKRRISRRAFQRLLRSEVRFGAVTKILREMALRDGWFDDEEVNRAQGLGRGFIGRKRARESFADLAASTDPALRLLGIYRKGEPVGYAILRYLGDHTRTMSVYVFVSPKSRARGLAPAAAVRLGHYLWEKGLNKVEAEVLSRDKVGRDFAWRLGLISEGKKREALWIDDKPEDVLIFGALLRVKYKGLAEVKENAA